MLLLFATPEGTPIDTTEAPKTITRASKPHVNNQSSTVNTSALGGRRSLTPSPEKPSGLGLVNQRRAVTPNPDQTQHEPLSAVSFLLLFIFTTYDVYYLFIHCCII